MINLRGFLSWGISIKIWALEDTVCNSYPNSYTSWWWLTPILFSSSKYWQTFNPDQTFLHLCVSNLSNISPELCLTDIPSSNKKSTLTTWNPQLVAWIAPPLKVGSNIKFMNIFQLRIKLNFYEWKWSVISNWYSLW